MYKICQLRSKRSSITLIDVLFVIENGLQTYRFQPAYLFQIFSESVHHRLFVFT